MLTSASPAEFWKPIPGFTGYEASSLGNIRTYRSINGRGPLKGAPRLLKPRPMKDKKYLRVTLTNSSGKQQSAYVHLIILEVFKGLKPSALHEGCHKDGNAWNNQESNLKWGTKQDNADDRSLHGTQVRGERVAQSKLTEAQVREIKAALPHWVPGMDTEFAQRFGVVNSTIHNIRLGRTWGHI